MSHAFITRRGGPAQGTGFPQFTYTGDYEQFNETDTDWKIKFYTSGTLTFDRLGSAKKGVDLFLVGGGGAGGNNQGHGGSGGYTATFKNVSVHANTPYEIVVGAGGPSENHAMDVGWRGAAGGRSSAFGLTANGGGGARGNNADPGGSGGGAYARGAGGSDGGNGADGYNVGGKGQGTTTREFGESAGELYAGGGGGAGDSSGGTGGTGGSGGGGSGGGSWGGTDGTVNTGGGGGGRNGCRTNLAGGSGIVIIRNHREAVGADG